MIGNVVDALQPHNTSLRKKTINYCFIIFLIFEKKWIKSTRYVFDRSISIASTKWRAVNCVSRDQRQRPLDARPHHFWQLTTPSPRPPLSCHRPLFRPVWHRKWRHWQFLGFARLVYPYSALLLPLRLKNSIKKINFFDSWHLPTNLTATFFVSFGSSASVFLYSCSIFFDMNLA